MAKRLYIQLYNAKSGESLTLPINPEQIEIPNEKDIPTYNILDYGEVAIKGNRQLQRITLEGILPAEDSYFSMLASLVKFLQYRPYSQAEARSMVDKWIENDEVIRVIISGEINKEFLVERQTQTVREYSEDVPYSIELLEYRNPTATPTALPSGVGKSKLQQLKERTIDKYIPSQLTGQVGQTIYKLAKLTYGGKFRELMDKNGITNPNLDIAGKMVEMLPL